MAQRLFEEAPSLHILATSRETLRAHGEHVFRLSPLDSPPDRQDITAADALAFPGLWRFLRRYPSTCWHEIQRSFSRELFCASLQRLVPEIRPDDLTAGGAGVRAQAMASDGSLVEDFHFVEGPGELLVVNAPSPGATASLALGEEIAECLARSA